MQRFATCVVAVLVSCGAAVTVAQKATTAADLDATMKKIGPAQGAAGKAIQSGAFADAKTNVATVKQALMDAENFWVVNKKDDAVKMNKDALARVTAVEEALSGASPDQQAVMAAFKQVGATCGACHKAYRAQDENQQYILKLQ
jgi:cytochrome c556